MIEYSVPGHDAMLDEIVGALREHLPMGPARVLDLGAGTGVLAERILEALPDMQMMLLDADAEMLAQAASRLDGRRVELMHGSFTEPLPSIDAAVASLSLHVLHERSDKVAVYRNVFAALRHGGIFVTADAMVPEAGALAEPIRRRWADHLVASGDTDAQAFERFARWAMEDRYYGVDEELDMLRDAGFRELDVRWRLGPSSVLIGRKVE